jgi:hypothetical protein
MAYAVGKKTFVKRASETSKAKYRKRNKHSRLDRKIKTAGMLYKHPLWSADYILKAMAIASQTIVNNYS